MTKLPAKITPDAIREALFELRFDHEELSETVLGRLADNPGWKGYSQTRLSGGSLPEQLRAAEPALRYLPWLELRGPDSHEIIRVGSNIVTHHLVGNYIGWDAFLPRLLATATFVLGAVPTASVGRLGLRYINALVPSEHFVPTIYDLNIRLEVGGHRPSENVQLVYQLGSEPNLSGIVRVLSPSFVEGAIPPTAVAVIDVDIFTDEPKGITGASDIRSWLVQAHDVEKRAFFNLLTPETITRLTEQ